MKVILKGLPIILVETFARWTFISPRGCKKFCVNRHFAGNCNFQKWNKNDYTIIITLRFN